MNRERQDSIRITDYCDHKKEFIKNMAKQMAIKTNCPWEIDRVNNIWDNAEHFFNCMNEWEEKYDSQM